MSIRLLAKYRYFFSSIMFSRCFSSIYRSVCSNWSCFTSKRYHLLNNPSINSSPSISRTNLMREISSTMSLSLFLLYLFYQLFGNFLFVITLIFAVLGEIFLRFELNVLFSSSAGLYALQDALLFQPNEPDTSRLIVQTPDLYQMPYETIFIETSDHERLHGFLIKQPQRSESCETLLFFHGNAGNIGHRSVEHRKSSSLFFFDVLIFIFRVQNAYLLYRQCQINILLFDYRGYGKSTGFPSEAGLYLDAQAVYDFARGRNDLNQQKIFLFGRSLGGAVAIHLGKTTNFSNEFKIIFLLIEQLLNCHKSMRHLHSTV